MVINTTKITVPIIQIINKAHRLRAANNPTNLEAAFSYLFLSTIFFPSFQSVFDESFGIVYYFAYMSFNSLFLFWFFFAKTWAFLILFTRFYLQTLILIGRFGYKFSAFLYKFVFCASPAFCYIRTLKAIRTIPRITATAPMPPLNFPKSVSALPLD